MAIELNAYLSFRDQAREVMEFYQSVFGGKLEQSTFEQFAVSDDPREKAKIMHSVLKTDTGMVLMAADTPNAMPWSPGTSISLSLSGDDDAVLSGYYAKLSAGGTIVEPLAVAPWGDKFGMLMDRFGQAWMVNISLAKGDA